MLKVFPAFNQVQIKLELNSHTLLLFHLFFLLMFLAMLLVSY